MLLLQYSIASPIFVLIGGLLPIKFPFRKELRLTDVLDSCKFILVQVDELCRDAVEYIELFDQLLDLFFLAVWLENDDTVRRAKVFADFMQPQSCFDLAAVLRQHLLKCGGIANPVVHADSDDVVVRHCFSPYISIARILTRLIHLEWFDLIQTE